MITYYFHVSAESRKKYQFEENLFSLQGDLIVSDFSTARRLADKINGIRKNEGRHSELVTAGQINALGLLHEIFHLLIRRYEEYENPGVIQRSINFLKQSLSDDELETTMLKFVEEFPPLPVYQKKISAKDYLNGKTGNKQNREIILEEIILLNLENINPATRQLDELYSDEKLAKETSYKNLIEHTEKFFESEKPVGDGGLNLIAFLKKPVITNPFDISSQLEFIKENWKNYLGDFFIKKILTGKDLISEDYKLFVKHGGGEKGTPPVPTYDYDSDYLKSLREKLAAGKKLSPEEYEYYQLEVKKFTQDIDWMPKVVMIAKNTFVWLDQLSKKYQREIKHLDQIPDEELDQLAKWNFNALWLIGIWERSSASQKIKQMMGNAEAAASAYSLYDYIIAKELGGESAFENLKQRCWQRGIRLSSDMVPNHTGIYSKWVIEKPEYFIQSSTPPFPSYRFTGPNLSDDDRVEIRIEDQYFTRTDAAVVFERLDKQTGQRRYIYHGNDGTNMPWNDTAQLNLLLPEVRESLIQTIMHVARKTPIIRFDAAMTLTKKHYQRLWFPIPGTGGAIPSRADYAMTRSEFDHAMPNEFWREVVDRINAEMPDTLLLAEAFWLMEGYFVRSLGMHRVYNSAFMHMFMKEENSKYRELIKNTLSYDPEILKRYVNFMSNPDEETAINQFGKGDKYFGVATMLVTLPGLPMFAHGQIEGFSEKYGMEYKRAYYNEFIDHHLVWQHEKEIFPLMKKRYLFSQVENFELYDFISTSGEVNENVFAFTNQSGNEKALVIYNNSYFEAFGLINYSCQKSRFSDGQTSNRKVAEALGFNNSSSFFYIFKDFVKNEEHILKGNDVWNFGISYHLWGYERKVFLDFREVFDYDGRYNRVYNYLQGRGVHSIEETIKELELLPLHESFVNIFLNDFLRINENGEIDFLLPEVQIEKFVELYQNKIDNQKSEQTIKEAFDTSVNLVENFISQLNKIRSEKRKFKELEEFNNFIHLLPKELKIESSNHPITQSNHELIINNSYIFLFKLLDKLFSITENNSAFNEFLLWKPLLEIFGYLGYGDSTAIRYDLLKLSCLSSLFEQYLYNSEHDDNISRLTKVKKSTKAINKASDDKNAQKNIITLLTELFSNPGFNDFVKLNEYEGVSYFNKEKFEEAMKWISFFALVNQYEKSTSALKPQSKKKALKERLQKFVSNFNLLKEAAEKSQYRKEKILNYFSKNE
ncbi:MAG: alpha-amylase family glycosyl hydrolase [Ignavibacterium album]|uniref:alpha-amylase family glycosyl hydrolase n=1 Tax=Ignavibacterium album TaxID=591197 RepID=UPI0026F0FC17|nr:alpha-amylase family glycosyl hydrolase [Ignavibacterium album]MCX8106790.1 alpha-amylase family glycosyl hydrolase [Ignavibacterium album]